MSSNHNQKNQWIREPNLNKSNLGINYQPNNRTHNKKFSTLNRVRSRLDHLPAEYMDREGEKRGYWREEEKRARRWSRWWESKWRRRRRRKRRGRRWSPSRRSSRTEASNSSPRVTHFANPPPFSINLLFFSQFSITESFIRFFWVLSSSSSSIDLIVW